MALARLRLSPWRNRVKPLQTAVLKCLLTSISAARPHTSGEPKPLYSALSGSIRAKFTNIVSVTTYPISRVPSMSPLLKRVVGSWPRATSSSDLSQSTYAPPSVLYLSQSRLRMATPSPALGTGGRLLRRKHPESSSRTSQQCMANDHKHRRIWRLHLPREEASGH
jgi:hypothetical protein